MTNLEDSRDIPSIVILNILCVGHCVCVCVRASVRVRLRKRDCV